MKNLKIFKLLKTFTNEEIKEFGKFVESPFHNNRKDVIRLFKLLKKYHPHFNESVNTSELFYKLYPGKRLNELQILKLYSFLFNLGKEYLIIKKLDKEKFYSDYFYLWTLIERNADDLYLTHYSAIDKRISKEKLDGEIIKKIALLKDLNCYFYQERMKIKKYLELIPDVIESFITHMLRRLLSIYCDALKLKFSHDNDFQIPEYNMFDNENINHTLDTLKKSNIVYYNYLLFYRYLILSIQEPGNELHYQKMKQLTFNNKELSFSELSSRFPHLQTYSYLKAFFENKSEYIPETFDLLKLELNTMPVLIQFGIFFQNLVAFGIYLKEYDYVENFLQLYSTNIVKEEGGEDILSVSRAMLYFSKKEYSNAIELLNTVKPSYENSVFDIKRLQLKILYETESAESLFMQIDTFKHYLSSTVNFTEETLNKYKVFVNYLKKLAKLKFDNSLQELEMFISRLEADKNIYWMDKPWLLEKAAELSIKKN